MAGKTLLKMQKTVWYRSAISMLAITTVGLLVTAPAGGQGLEQSLTDDSAQEQGLEQSPINIRAKDLKVVDNLPKLQFNYGTRVTLDVVNTGSPGGQATVQVNVPDGAGQLQVAGVTYKLQQFHFHTPSEDLIDGKKFPLEMHLVHQAADGTRLAVGIFIVSGAGNLELNRIFSNLPKPDESKTLQNFNLRKLLPEERESFRYRGSLTTPSFTEGVRWVVLEETNTLTRGNIQNFRTLFPEGNSREVQPLNGRKVLTDVKRR